MHKSKVTGIVAGVGALLAATSVMAQERDQYLQVNLGAGVAGNTHASIGVDGIGSASDDFSPQVGFFTSVAAGHIVAKDFGLEVEGLYTSNNIDTGSLDRLIGASAKASVDTYGGLVNLVYNAPLKLPVTPYVGVGVGYGGARYEIAGASQTGGGFMWQVKAGVTYPVSKTVTLDFGYRYLGTPDFKLSGTIDDISGTVKAQTNIHVLSVGARISY